MFLIPGQNANNLSQAAVAMLEEQIAALAQNLSLSNSPGSLRFSSTKVQSIALGAGKIVKVVNAENKNRRTSLKIAEDSTCQLVILLHGYTNEPTFEDMNLSPWSLKPGDLGTDDLDGGYDVWALAIGGDATIKVALEYEDLVIETGDKRMQIQGVFGVGRNWDSTHPWASEYGSELNSLIDGFKMFNFSSFDPGKEYTFVLNPGSLNFQAIAHPVNIYLLNFDSILRALFWRMTHGKIELNEIRATIIPILKSKSWAARLPSTGGQFTIKPFHGSSVGLIDVKVVGETYAKTSIFNFEPNSEDSGTFVLEGY